LKPQCKLLIVHDKSSLKPIVITGNFTANNTNEEEFRKICSLSGVINLLSLARSYIASATSLAGGPPVILPFIDLTSK
jgi:preprotein translocase subunit SecB